MNLVICTSVGMLTIITGIGCVALLLWPVTQLLEWLSKKDWRGIPSFLYNVAVYSLLALFLGGLLYSLLGASHEIGCDVIHLVRSK